MCPQANDKRKPLAALTAGGFKVDGHGAVDEPTLIASAGLFSRLNGLRCCLTGSAHFAPFAFETVQQRLRYLGLLRCRLVVYERLHPILPGLLQIHDKLMGGQFHIVNAL